MTKLILIRHGETDYNLQRKYCGFSDPPLNKKGILQAEKLTDRLRGIKIDKIYSSDSKRACETANIIFIDNLIEALQDFREMNFGVFEGLRYDEIIKKYPRLYKNWSNNPAKVKIPQGETLRDLGERVKKRLSFILSQHGNRKVALITHGGPIRVILCDALKLDLNSFWKIKQDIATLNVIDYPENSSPTVVKMNDTSHLIAQEAVTV